MSVLEALCAYMYVYGAATPNNQNNVMSSDACIILQRPPKSEARSKITRMPPLEACTRVKFERRFRTVIGSLVQQKLAMNNKTTQANQGSGKKIAEQVSWLDVTLDSE